MSTRFPHSAPFPEDGASSAISSSLLVAHQRARPGGPLGWWYRFSSPPDPGPQASFAERDLFRRGRMTSNIILFCICFNVLGLPAALFGTNRLLLVVLIGSPFLEALAIALNRTRHCYLAGAVTIMIFEIGITFNLVTTPGGVSTVILPIFDLFVIPLLFAVFTLPRLGVICFTLADAALVLIGLLIFPRTPDLAAQVSSYYIAIATVPCFLFAIVCGSGLVWNQSMIQEIKRADRAEEVARLERDLSEHDKQAALEKARLEQSIQQIVYVLTQVANGHHEARIPGGDNSLWAIIGPVNNLLHRNQRLRQMEAEYARTREVISALQRAVQQARYSGQPVYLPEASTGTLLDPLLRDLQQTTLTFAPPEMQQRRF
jgi:hypothetical protein